MCDIIILREVAVGKQHKEKFYHFQDNKPCRKRVRRPIFSCYRGGRGSCKKENKPQAGLLGQGERTDAQGGMEPLPAQSATESIMCVIVSGMVMNKGCWAPLNLGFCLFWPVRRARKTLIRENNSQRTELGVGPRRWDGFLEGWAWGDP